MIRSLRLADLPGCLLLGLSGSHNRLRPQSDPAGLTPDWMGLPAEAVRAFSGKGGPVMLAQAERARIDCIAAAFPRSGPGCWELGRLSARPGAEEAGADVLAALVGSFSRHGAARVSLRIPADDPLRGELGAAGLTCSHAETLHVGSGRGDHGRTPAGVRRRQEADLHGLFRLYSEATPHEVRAHGTMTLQQWASNLPRPPGRTEEYVLEQTGRLTGWLRVSVLRTATDISVLVRPGRDRAAVDLVDLGLSIAPTGRPAVMLVAEYQGAELSAARGAGLAATAELSAHARSMAAAARLPEEARAYEAVSA